MLKKDLPEAKKNFYENAVKVLAETGADHVAYCHIEYDEDGEIKSAHFPWELRRNSKGRTEEARRRIHELPRLPYALQTRPRRFYQG